MTSSSALDAARQTAPFLEPRHIYADLNSVSPALKQDIAQVIGATGARFVEVIRTVNGTPMAVPVETSPTFQAGIPRRLFALPPNVGAWTVTADGKRILTAMPEQQNAQEPITVVLNWEAGVKR